MTFMLFSDLFQEEEEEFITFFETENLHSIYRISTKIAAD